MQSVTSNAVAEKISTLGNDFTFTQVSELTYANFQSFKFGNMCVLTGAINGSNMSNGASLLTLPSGYRPSKTVYINGVCESSSAKYPCVFQVSASGGINFWHYGSNVTGVFMSIIFKC
jgi:hypothetical protein